MSVMECISELFGLIAKHKLLALLIVVAGGTYFTEWTINKKKRLKYRHDALNRRQRAAGMKIALAEQLHTDDSEILSLRQKIINLPIMELIQGIKSGQYTAVQVLNAFQARALECTRQTNCVTEPIMEAEEWAKELDSRDDKSGLLFGIPFSVKESLGVEGYDCNYGISKYIDEIASSDHVLIQVLKSQGAIPFMRTNLPQTMFSFTCSNPIFGETVNPYDCERSPSGSSGGEGALIGLNGSLFGIGSDIAGSVRVPAHYCGICALKPTHRRLSGKGEPTVVKGQKGVPGVNGPMARDVDSLALVTKAMLQPEMFELDCSIAPVPFNDKVYQDKTPLTVGYYDDDGYFTPVPSCRRAVAMTVEALEKAGHKVIQFKVPSLKDDVECAAGQHLFKLIHADANKRWFSHLEGEETDRFLSTQIAHSARPSLIHHLLYPHSFLSPRERTYLHNSKYGITTTDELYDNYTLKDDYVAKFVAAWKDAGIDVLVGPAFGITAPSNDYGAKLMFLGGTTGLYNMIDFPAGIVKVTNVTVEDEEKLTHNFKIRDNYDRMAKEACKDSIGLPVGVQCVALPWREELCLRLMKEIETAIKEFPW